MVPDATVTLVAATMATMSAISMSSVTNPTAQLGDQSAALLQAPVWSVPVYVGVYVGIEYLWAVAAQAGVKSRRYKRLNIS